ncbi:hypothetical protein BCR43DRAFT_496715 [Syncephalastrum racemosum]|uniref:Uncharacterized protein n=1 Tax=Syncephalastrum racemosum TaxID=13706 RepID=A0A1X2H4M4_SYNRA|nr:hypothetical protein BCR43DRAFT_496715 [Syncephalastrum racemosum]
MSESAGQYTTSGDNIHFQKPDTIDAPVYVKPNAYDDDEPCAQSPSTPITPIETVIKLEIGHNKRPVSPIKEREDPLAALPPGQTPNEKEEPDRSTHSNADASSNNGNSDSCGSSRRSSNSNSSSNGHVTDSILSEPPSATTQTTMNEELSKYMSTLSFKSNNSTYAPSLAGGPSPSTSTGSQSSRILSSLHCPMSKKKKRREEMLVFELRKHTLVKPHLHDIYEYGTKRLVYRKEQPHSYSWGFQNTLYRDTCQVAEAHRRAFQKDIVIQVGDTEQKMVNRTNSHLLFMYQTVFDGFRIAWKRPSLLSHDMVVTVVKQDDSDDLGAAVPPPPRVLAEFDSHGMGYLVHLGRLAIDRAILSEFDDPKRVEVYLLMTCCTLVDLMREVVEKAVGLGDGGVAGSD